MLLAGRNRVSVLTTRPYMLFCGRVAIAVSGFGFRLFVVWSLRASGLNSKVEIHGLSCLRGVGRSPTSWGLHTQGWGISVVLCGLLHVVPDTGRLRRCCCEDSHRLLNENFMMVVTEYGA